MILEVENNFRINLSSNFEANRNDSENIDELQKIKTIVNNLVKNFNRIPIGEHPRVDKEIIRFKGKCCLKQYVPRRPKKWGYKAFLLCDSTRFRLRFISRTKKESVGKEGVLVQLQ